MSFTVNNSQNANGGATSQAVTISIASGHTVACVWIVANSGAGGTVTSITDSGGNTYTLGASATLGGDIIIGTASSVAVASPLTSVTAHGTGDTTFIGLWVWDISATGTITLADTKALANGSTTTGTDAITTGVMTLTASDGLILGACTDTNSNPVAAGTGFTADATGENSSPSEHKAVTSSAAATFTDAVAGSHAYAAGLAFQVSATAAAPFKPTDLDERITTKSVVSDFIPPNLLTQKTLKLPPFTQEEIWPRTFYRGVYTDFSPPNVLTPGTLKLPPFIQENDGARTFWRGVYTDFAPPNLSLTLPIAVAPVKPVDVAQLTPLRWSATDFAPPNLLAPQTLKLPPFIQRELPGWAITAKGVYTDFSPPNLNLTLFGAVPKPLAPVDLSQQVRAKWASADFSPPNLLIAVLPAPPTVPGDPTTGIRIKGVYTDFAAPNLVLSSLAPPAAAPLLPQDISGIRLEARGLRSDFLPPNLTLTLPVRPPVLSSGAGRHGTQAEAHRRRELDVLRAKIEAFKEQRAEAEKALIATEDREVDARTRVLKRIRLKASTQLSKPVEQYAPVAKAIAARNVALERHRAILTHLTRHQLDVERIEREIQQGDEEAALYLMQWLMMETEWRE